MSAENSQLMIDRWPGMYSAQEPHFLETDPTREENLPILINDTGLRYRRFFTRQVKDLGLTAAQWEVLSYI